MEEYFCDETKFEIPSRRGSSSTPRVSAATTSVPWERHPLLNKIRKRWAFLTKYVTRPGFERFIGALPKAALAWVVLVGLGIKFLSRYPFGKRLFAKIVELVNKRYVRIAAKGTAAFLGGCGAVFVYWFYKVYIQWRPVRDPNVKMDNRPFLAFGGAGLLYPFYWGVIAYCKDNFDVSDIRASGLSAGLYTVGSVMIDKQAELIEMVMHVMHRLLDEYDSFLCIEGTLLFFVFFMLGIAVETVRKSAGGILLFIADDLPGAGTHKFHAALGFRELLGVKLLREP